MGAGYKSRSAQIFGWSMDLTEKYVEHDDKTASGQLEVKEAQNFYHQGTKHALVTSRAFLVL